MSVIEFIAKRVESIKNDTVSKDKALEDAEKRNQDILDRNADGELSEDEEVVFVGKGKSEDGSILEGGTLYCTGSKIFKAPEGIPEKARESGNVQLKTTVKFVVKSHDFITANGGKLIATHKDMSFKDLIIENPLGKVNFGDCTIKGKCTPDVEIEWKDYHKEVILLPDGETEHYILTEKSYAICKACPAAQIKIDFHGQVAMITDEAELMHKLAILESMNPMS